VGSQSGSGGISSLQFHRRHLHYCHCQQRQRQASKQASNKTTKMKKYERSSHLVKEKETNDPTLGLCVHQGAACASTLLRAAFPFLSISLWSAGLRGKAFCVVLW
jgi:hypothetical protein